MAAKKKVAVFVDPEGIVPAEVKKVNTDKYSAVKVIWKGRERVYSRELHGDKFYDYALEFNTKANGTLEPLA